MESPQDNQREGMEEPLLVSPSKGGLRTLPFIIGSVGFGTVAFWGLDSNMIIYLTKEYGMKMAKGSNIINLWEATSNFFPILGAFLADSYVGRFTMISFGCIVSIMGMILFWSTTIIPGATPSCDDHDLAPNNNLICTSTTPMQLILLYSSFALIAIASGAGRSSTLAFGADQLRSNRGISTTTGVLESYFNWYFVIMFSSLIFAQTCMVYIQDHMGWTIGFGLAVLFMFLSAISFFLGTSFYIKSQPKASLLTGLAQVLVASWRNRHFDLSTQKNTERLYHVARGSRIDMPSDKLKFLNKACVIKNPTQDLASDGSLVDSWSICSVDQVEELKSLIKIVPLWSTGIILNVNISQGSFRVLQANSMDRHVFTSSFEIPAASFGIFAVITTTLWLALYDSTILPLASKIMGKTVHLNVKTRMGIGLILSIASLVVSAVVEGVRLQLATKGEKPTTTRPMSALWLLPHTCLIGLAEGFMVTAQNEFFYSELPKSMSSVASTLYSLGMAVAGFVASLIISVVDNVTTRGGGQRSWLSTDPNKGHYDYYYWVLAALCFLNYIYFLFCSRAYGHGNRICHG